MGFVYFLRQPGPPGPVKIGHSANPTSRLDDYSRWSPVPLEIAATIEGCCRMERQFHARHMRHHSHHEWFHWSRGIQSDIDAIVAGRFDVTTLPEPKAIRRKRGGHQSQLSRACVGLRHRIHAMRKAGHELPESLRFSAWAMSCPNEPVDQRVDNLDRVWSWLEGIERRPDLRSTVLIREILDARRTAEKGAA